MIKDLNDQKNKIAINKFQMNVIILIIAVLRPQSTHCCLSFSQALPLFLPLSPNTFSCSLVHGSATSARMRIHTHTHNKLLALSPRLSNLHSYFEPTPPAVHSQSAYTCWVRSRYANFGQSTGSPESVRLRLVVCIAREAGPVSALTVYAAQHTFPV